MKPHLALALLLLASIPWHAGYALHKLSEWLLGVSCRLTDKAEEWVIE